MSVTEYGVNDPLAQKLWSKMMLKEALKDTSFDGLWGESEDALLRIMPETGKDKGDRVRVPLTMQATGAGTTEGETQEGNEEGLVTYYDDLLVNELGNAHKVPNTGKNISEQRVPFEPRELCRSSLRDWWSERLDTSLFNQLCGNTYVTSTKYTGLNATIAPTSTRHLWSEAAADSDDDLDSSGDEFTLAMIDKAVAKAKTLTPRIKPARIKGYSQRMFVCFLHPNQTYQLRQGALGQSLTYAEINKNLIQAGQTTDNPIFSGARAIGIYNNTLLLENPHVTTGAVTTTQYANVRRAVFCGASAAVIGFGKGYGPESMSWDEELFDYKRWFGVRASSIFGIKKTVFNSSDYATIVLSSYSPDL